MLAKWCWYGALGGEHRLYLGSLCMQCNVLYYRNYWDRISSLTQCGELWADEVHHVLVLLFLLEGVMGIQNGFQQQRYMLCALACQRKRPNPSLSDGRRISIVFGNASSGPPMLHGQTRPKIGPARKTQAFSSVYLSKWSMITVQIVAIFVTILT